jgi:hypothetical protein
VYRTSGIDAKLADRATMADGAYRGNPEVIIPYPKPDDGTALPPWKEDLNAVHRQIDYSRVTGACQCIDEDAFHAQARPPRDGRPNTTV